MLVHGVVVRPGSGGGGGGGVVVLGVVLGRGGRGGVVVLGVVLGRGGRGGVLLLAAAAAAVFVRQGAGPGAWDWFFVPRGRGWEGYSECGGGGGLRRGGRTTAKLFGEKEGKIKPPSSAKEDIRPTRAVPAFRLRLFSIESITKRTRNRHGEQDKEEDEARAEHCGVIDNWGKRQLGNDFFG